MNPCVKAIICAFAGAGVLAGCGAPPGSIEPSVVHDTVQKDLQNIYQHGPEAGQQKLKLEDVLARALKYNLDTKVSELDELIAADDVTLEMLNALPSVTAKVQRVGRSNEGGSSSFSVLTGQQSLQPSISSDQYRNVHQLSAEWNLLEAGINLWRAKSATDRMLIAQERRRKVYHTVLQDTYASYWRMAVAQRALPVIDGLLSDVEARLGDVQQQIDQGLVPLGDAQTAKASLQDRRQKLMNLKQGLALAETELKTLIDYPPDQAIVLDLGGRDWLNTGGLPAIKGTFDDFENTAFVNRPEIREEVLNKNISMRDIKMSIVETIPGAEFLFTYNYDSNSFLVYDRWVDGIIGLVQSVNKIITAPTRYKRAKNMDVLADKRRQALVAAVITQVHVAKARYDFLSDAYRQSSEIAQNADDILKRARDFNDTGLMSSAELLNVKIDSSIAEINRAFAYADAQDAYGRFIVTLGVDLWDADDAGLSVPDYARQIEKNLADENIFVSAAPPQGEML